VTENRYFRASWAKQVRGVICGDQIETDPRYYREACLREEAMADLAAEQAGESILMKWKDMWSPLRVNREMDVAQVMVGAAAILQERYGKAWAASCRLTLYTDGAQLPRATPQTALPQYCRLDLEQQLPKPSKAFMVMHTSSHWFLLYS
jgi:hypothetical protein